MSNRDGNGKKLVGVYLPVPLLVRLKQYIATMFERGVRLSQSAVIAEALEEFLARRSARCKKEPHGE